MELQKRAIAAFRAAGRRRDCAVALANLAGPSRLLGDQAEASRALEEALPIAHESGDRSLEATVLHNIGVGHVDTGNYALSIEHFKRSRELRRAVGDPSGEIHSLTSEAMAHAELAQGADALRCLQDAVAIVGRVPAHEKLLIPVIEGARGYFHLLGSEAVAAVFEQARALAALPTLLEILEMEAGTFGFRGHFAQGLAAISAGVAMAKEHARDRLAADFLSVRVSLLVLMGETAAADEACREMDSLAARGEPGATWDVLMSRAQIAEHAGDRDRARVRYREALNAAGIERLRVLASLPAARLELDGDPATAIRLLEGPAAREPRGLRTQRPRLLATLAAAQAGTGRLEEAREALAAAEASRDTWASSCDDLFAREMLARAHRAVGDLEGSARLLAALLESARGLGFHGLARRVERDAAAWR
ncbi:MAG: tetratricopeptide repeat protein [Planctomycetia bacterium]|nr:tetratricopeptide repeat protein [Planctomycetia bacterium]